MIVMKFGGTSVGSAKNIKHVSSLIEQNDEPVIAVLSAMSGTTNKLVEICNYYYGKQADKAAALIDGLQEKYYSEIKNLLATPSWQQTTMQFVAERMDYIRSFANDIFTTFEEKCILAQGELMSTQMMLNYMHEQNIEACMLPALDFMRIDKNCEPDLDTTKTLLGNLLEANSKHKIYITQGFICRNAYGEIDNLQRGGSDYSASLIGAAMKATEIQIWTDIDGVHNNDPRIVEGTSPVSNLSYEEASELAFFGAKILHPTCVKPAQKADIPIRLKNTMQPDAHGTLINQSIEKNSIKAVAAKDDMYILRISNSRQLPTASFIASVYSICDNYQTVCFVSSFAETSMSICVEDNEHIDEITEEIRQIGNVDMKKDMCIITIVGDLNPQNTAMTTKTTDAMKGCNIQMISFGGSNYSISYVVGSSEKHKAMKELSKTLF